MKKKPSKYKRLLRIAVIVAKGCLALQDLEWPDAARTGASGGEVDLETGRSPECAGKANYLKDERQNADNWVHAFTTERPPRIEP